MRVIYRESFLKDMKMIPVACYVTSLFMRFRI